MPDETPWPIGEGSIATIMPSKLDVYGHSYPNGFLLPDAAHAYPTRLANLIHATLNLQAISNSEADDVGGAQGAIPDVFSQAGLHAVARPSPAIAAPQTLLPVTQAALVDIGLNDFARNGTNVGGWGAQASLGFRNAIRALISWLVAGAGYIPTHASIAYAAGGGPAWAVDAANPAWLGHLKPAGGNGNTITITVPQAGAVTTYWAGENAAGQGATLTWTKNGGATSVNTDTRTQYEKAGLYTTVATQHGACVAGDVLVGTVANFNTLARFLGYSIQAAYTPLILMLAQPRLTVNLADTDRAAGNADLLAAVAEWNDPQIQYVDVLDGVLQKTPANYQSDGVHPNQTSHVKIANALYTYLQSAAISRPALLAGA